MSLSESLGRLNRRYDALPELWRFQFVVWLLVALGAINMVLTLAIRFPFALLVVLGIVLISIVRLPYQLGWVSKPADPETLPYQPKRADWLIGLNQRYEAMPEPRRFWVYPAVLLAAGAINMMLTIAYGFPFGLLALLALLALVAIRAPYTAGWIQHPVPTEVEPEALNHDLPPPAATAFEPEAMPQHPASPPEG